MHKPSTRKPVAFKALLTKAEVKRGFKADETREAVRRIALLGLLTKSSSEMLAMVQNPKAARKLLSFAEDVRAYLEWRKLDTRLLSVAENRILATLKNRLNEIDQPAKRRARAG